MYQSGGTQQVNSYTKPAVTNIIPVTAILGRVNEASHSNELPKCCDKNYAAQLNVSSEGNERQGVGRLALK
jgi:hypothetical protein